MDDMAEYRRRHREAYLKRVGLDSEGARPGPGEPGGAENAEPRSEPSTSSGKDTRAREDADYGPDLFSDDGELSEKSKRERYKLGRHDEDYEASLELAKKLQREFDSMDSMDSVRKPDDSYKECLLSSVGHGGRHDEGADMDLQRAIAKSLVDM